MANSHPIDTPWFSYYNTPTAHPWALEHERSTGHYEARLDKALKGYTRVYFDHIRVAHLGRRIAVFIARGSQSAVLYDKTKSFPSAKLLASLVLLGTS